MGATRLVLTVGVVGVAAGAFLALATVPALAPYSGSSREPRPVILHKDYAEPAPYDYAETALEPNVRIAPGAQQGTFVLELPRWAEETDRWLTFGQRALRTWRIWKGEDGATDSHGAYRQDPAYGIDRDGKAPYGYRDDDEPVGDAEPFVRQPTPEPRSYAQAYAERQASRAFDPRTDDAAAEAARSARDAARDVRDAEEAW